MKKKDLIVIIILVLLIGGGYFVFQLLQGEKEVVEVYYKNQVVETIGCVKQGSSKQLVCVPNEIYVIQTGAEDNIQK